VLAAGAGVAAAQDLWDGKMLMLAVFAREAGAIFRLTIFGTP